MIVVFLIGGLGFFVLRSKIKKLEAKINMLEGERGVSVAPINKSEEGPTDRLAGKLTFPAISLLVFLAISFWLFYDLKEISMAPLSKVLVASSVGIFLFLAGIFKPPSFASFSGVFSLTGSAIFYLTVFAALSIHQLIPQSIAFFLMSLITLFGLLLGLFRKNQWLVFAGLLGGFATPFLLGVLDGNFSGFFSYLVILNLFVIGVAILEKEARLSFLAFAFNWVCFLIWYGRFYTEEQHLYTVFSIIVFFSLFLFPSLVHSFNNGQNKTPFSFKWTDLFPVLPPLFFICSLILITPSSFEGNMSLVSVLLSLALSYGLIAFFFDKKGDSVVGGVVLPAISLFLASASFSFFFSGYFLGLIFLFEAILLSALAEKFKKFFFQEGAVIVFLFSFNLILGDLLRDGFSLGGLAFWAGFLGAISAFVLYFVSRRLVLWAPERFLPIFAQHQGVFLLTGHFLSFTLLVRIVHLLDLMDYSRVFVLIGLIYGLALLAYGFWRGRGVVLIWGGGLFCVGSAIFLLQEVLIYNINYGLALLALSGAGFLGFFTWQRFGGTLKRPKTG